MTRYAVTLWLTVKGPDSESHFDAVVEQYARVEQVTDWLLDCAWSLDAKDSHGEVGVEATVTATSADDALEKVIAAVLDAIRRAGGYALDWDAADVPSAAVVYRLANEEVTVIDAA